MLDAKGDALYVGSYDENVYCLDHVQEVGTTVVTIKKAEKKKGASKKKSAPRKRKRAA